MEWEALVKGAHLVIGSDPDTITWWQMSIRAVIVFFYLLILIRVGSKRIFGKNTSFDIVVGVMLGSILGRALTANSALLPTLAASFVLLLLHMLMAKLAFHSPRIGHLVKGTEVQLVDAGKILWDNLRRTSVTEHDLMEGLRTSGGLTEIDQVKAAYLERNGKVSVIKNT